MQIAPLLFGSDPEAFLSQWQMIVGSERVVPPEGLLSFDGGPKVVRDGVQIELMINPKANREALGGEIATALATLKQRIGDPKFRGFSVNFDQVVDVSEWELAQLSAKSRQFGCAISYNLYGLSGPEDDPSTYRKRTAGGHIHLGLFNPIFSPKDFTEEEEIGEDGEPRLKKVFKVDLRRRLAYLIDIVVGNTAVMIDRHPFAAERRRNYGKAGEYRLPNHGLEYRTLSNWWLRSYQTMGLVMGLSRLATSILHTSLLDGAADGELTLEAKLKSKIDFDKLVQAIQENDLLLAHDNWLVVKDFIQEYGAGLGDECGLNPSLLDNFEMFLKMTQEQGLEHWFPESPLSHWVWNNKMESWESFLATKVG